MEAIKRNITLILGFSIPILMILIVAGAVYIPQFFAKLPRYNFLYVVPDNYYGGYYGGLEYFVQKGKLSKIEVKNPDDKNFYPPRVPTKLFIYDVYKNESREVSFEDVVNLNLDSNIKSKDGFEFVRGSGGGGMFPFFGSPSNYNTFYLKGHNVSKKINIQLNGYYYNNNINFLGWIN